MRRRDRLAKLRKIALGGFAGGRQAAELLRGLDDAELWRAVLEDCGLKDDQPVLGPFFGGPESTLPERRRMWLQLVGGAPATAPMDASLLAPERLAFVRWQLQSWPAGPLPRFASVLHLRFDRCWLAAVPDFATTLPQLRGFEIERARLTEPLPEALFARPLEVVRIAHAWLSEFPRAAMSCASLRTLDLTDNRIVELPPELARGKLDLELGANPLSMEARRIAEAAGARVQ